MSHSNQEVSEDFRATKRACARPVNYEDIIERRFHLLSRQNQHRSFMAQKFCFFRIFFRFCRILYTSGSREVGRRNSDIDNFRIEIFWHLRRKVSG